MNTRPQLTVHIGKHVYEFTGRYWYVLILGVPVRVYNRKLINQLNAIVAETRGG